MSGSPMDWQWDPPQNLKRSIHDFSEGQPIQDRRDGSSSMVQTQRQYDSPQNLARSAHDFNGGQRFQDRRDGQSSIVQTQHNFNGGIATNALPNRYPALERPQPVPAIRLLQRIGRGALTVANFTFRTGLSLVQNGYYLGRSIYQNPEVRRTATVSYIAFVQTAGGIKRRAVQLVRPIIVRRRRIPERRRPLQQPRLSPHTSPLPPIAAPLPVHVVAQPLPDPLDHLRPHVVEASVLDCIATKYRISKNDHTSMRQASFSAPYAKTPKQVTWKDCPETGMPTDKVKFYTIGEAINYQSSSDLSENSRLALTDSPIALQQAIDSASPLSDQLAMLGPAKLREQAHLMEESIALTQNQPPGTSSNPEFMTTDDKGMDAECKSVTQEGRALSTRKELGEIANNSVTKPTRGRQPAMVRTLLQTPTPASGYRKTVASTTQVGSITEGSSKDVGNLAYDNRPFEVFEQTFGSLSVSKRTRANRQKAEAERKERAEKEAREEAEKEAAAEKERLAEAETERLKRLTRILPTEKVIKPLSAEWDSKVDQTMALGLHATELAKVSTGTSLGRRDFGTLLPCKNIDRAGGWLNDEIVNGYIQAVVDYGLSKTRSGKEFKMTPKYHAFNTFFYKKLREDGPKTLLRWSKRAKIGGRALLDVERIFIPVHEHAHWTLLVVSPINRTIEYFDSLNGCQRRFVAHAVDWLKEELGSAYVAEEWQALNSQSPQQGNGLDCGVFAATTAKMVMMGVNPMAYGHGDIPLQRRRMVAELLNGGFVGDFAL